MADTRTPVKQFVGNIAEKIGEKAQEETDAWTGAIGQSILGTLPAKVQTPEEQASSAKQEQEKQKDAEYVRRWFARDQSDKRTLEQFKADERAKEQKKSNEKVEKQEKQRTVAVQKQEAAQTLQASQKNEARKNHKG